jgi:flagellar hook-length control protein FliK
MILKPENLGNVKISLELSDKIINGQIVVHSKEAFEAFKQNLDTLRQAFRESGFDNANFNLSLADNGTGNFSQGRDETGAQFMANKTYSNYAGSDEVVQPQSESTAYTTSDDYHVDVVA